jgi:protein O-mannosyl-transferase
MSFKPTTKNQLFVLICLALTLATFALYAPMLHHGFVILDDQVYVTENPHVTSGLAWTNVVWAFKTSAAANWHPLTWISHMADCQMFGLNAGGHHLVNLLFHIANTLLLFFWLNKLTGAMWRSAFVAALFAWHPLHVESVAWASERKDVLSAFFWMLALIAYARFAALSEVRSPKSKVFYILALFLFACGLMSKPMVVTLPFVLLLLDFWPLQRFRISDFRFPIFFRLVLEKIPFFVLAFASCLITYLVQKSGGATWSQAALPFHARVANALVAYVRYVSKTFWPADLAVIYPYSRHWPAVLVIGSALALAAWTGLFLWRARRNPHLIVGWLWFLGTLVPAIGLVQVGSQSMADRYTYIPGIGLFIVIVWGANDLLSRWPEWKKFLPVAGGVALAGCLMATSIQLNYWQDSVKLFSHAIRVTTDNYTACNFLGRALDGIGQKNDALLLYAESVRIEPRYPQAQFNLGMDLWNAGRLNEACEHLKAAVELVPDNAEARYYLGDALMENGKPNEAIAQFTEALRLKPGFVQARRKLDEALAKRGGK